MATSDPKPRIMAHMNKEHGADLKRYLQAFNGLSSSAASGAQLTDLALDTLTIKSASGVHDVRISPPMKSFADARVRLVEMAERSQAKLGLSDIRIDRFLGPRGGGLRRRTSSWSDTPRNGGLDDPGRILPLRRTTFVWLVKAIAGPVAVIHITEAWWMANGRLAKYGVEAGSALWFKWVLETFMEGYPVFVRFDELVQEERKKKDAAKH